MPASLDLNLLPLLRQEGQDQQEWPGLYAATPPRGAARGRDADLLILYLTVGGTAPLPADQMSQLMPRLAQMYYRTAGTVTAALKAVVEELNRYLLERNVRASNTGRQGVGYLTQAVLRGDLLYLAHSGPLQSYLLNASGTELMGDDASAGRGLGVSRTAALRYFQSTLQPGDFLVLCHQPEEGWNVDTVRGAPGQSIETLRRRLLSAARTDFHAVIVQSQGGTGKLRLLRLKSPFQDMARPTEKAAPEASAAVTPAGAEPAALASPLEPQTESNSPGAEAPPAVPAVTEAGPEPASSLPPAAVDAAADQPGLPPAASAEASGEPVPAPDLQAHDLQAHDSLPPARLKVPPQAAVPPAAAKTASAHPRPAKKPSAPRPQLPSLGPILFQPLRRVFGAIFQAVGRTLGAFLRLLGGLFKRMLPDETLLNISPSTMIFLAVLVPIVISLVGGMMYVQRGQALQYDEAYQKALAAVERAETSEGPDDQRTAWRLALEMLSDAETYQVTAQSVTLRQRAQTALDLLDGAERLDFRPAVLGGLDKGMRITRMAALPGELYMLDSYSGSVLRAILTGSSFERDPQFVCGPVQGDQTVGPLIDLASLARGNETGAAVVAMDANGGLIFCIPGDQPLVTHLAPPPMNFQTPKAFTIDSDNLYVLDPGNNAVWVYRGMDFAQPPRLFFGDQVPFMQDVVDLAVYNDDLYLLHSDGHQTMCTYSTLAESPSRCEDPLVYTDARPGRESGAVIPDSLFDQMLFAPPPDPSLYLLDPINQSIFHFSLRMNFQRQYRSANPLPAGSATAFTFSSDRLLYLAVGSAVYFALLP